MRPLGWAASRVIDQKVARARFRWLTGSGYFAAVPPNSRTRASKSVECRSGRPATPRNRSTSSAGRTKLVGKFMKEARSFGSRISSKLRFQSVRGAERAFTTINTLPVNRLSVAAAPVLRWAHGNKGGSEAACARGWLAPWSATSTHPPPSALIRATFCSSAPATACEYCNSAVNRLRSASSTSR